MDAVEELKELEAIIGAGMFRVKEEQIKGQIRDLVAEIEEGEISDEDIRKITAKIKGTLSEDIIKERERI